MCPSGRVQDEGLSYWTGSSWTTHRTPKNTYISCSAFGRCLNFILVRELSKKCYMLVMRAGSVGVRDVEKVKLVIKCVKDVLRKYQDVMLEFLHNNLPLRQEVDYKIEVKLRTKSPSKTPYHLSQRELEELKVQLDELLSKGLIRQSKSP